MILFTLGVACVLAGLYLTSIPAGLIGTGILAMVLGATAKPKPPQQPTPKPPEPSTPTP